MDSGAMLPSLSVFPCVETAFFAMEFHKGMTLESSRNELSRFKVFFHASDIRLLHSADFLFQCRNFDTY